MNKNRYMTPIKYVNGNGVTRTSKLYFELSPVELIDWMQENPFEANELQASLNEMKTVHEDESRDLTSDEIMTMMGLIRLIAQISAGRPTEDGEYFIKDPNWVHSYAYREFRQMLFTNPKEMNVFMQTLMNTETISKFTAALEQENEKLVSQTGKSIDEMTPEELREAMKNRMKANVEVQATKSGTTTNDV